MIHKVIILGSGPAGLTAGIYAGRAKLAPLIIEGSQPGGQLMTTTWVENWPGEIHAMGPDIMMKLRDHAAAYGAQFMQDTVVRVDLSQKPYRLYTENGTELATESIIISTGSSHRKLGAIGEQEYWGRGVTTCATCDGPFYQDREVLIAGGGNTAMTEASFLKGFARKVTVVQILDAITANDPIKDTVIGDPKVEIIVSNRVVEIRGDGNHVTEVVIENQNTKERTTISTAAVFVAVGFSPNTGLFEDQLERDKYGYLILHDKTKTSKDGVFACGDVADYQYRQAITSAGYGCMAALDCESYLRSLKLN